MKIINNHLDGSTFEYHTPSKRPAARWRRIFGALLIFTPLFLIFAAMVAQHGWLKTIACWAAAIILTIMVVKGNDLIG